MDRWIVLYDADCGLCRWLLAAILRWDRDRALAPVALQSDDARALLSDLSPGQRMASWHLISPRGKRFSGGAALAPMLRLMPHGKLPAAAAAAMPTVTERAYRWVAAHRAQLASLVSERAKRRASVFVKERGSGSAGR